MCNAKKDVAVAYITYLVNRLLAQNMSSNSQPQHKKEFMCKTRSSHLYHRLCSQNGIITKLN